MDRNEPAFPVSEELDRAICEGTSYGSLGMTMRDYFAAKAMAGFCATANPNTVAGLADDISRCAYAQADSMLAERAKDRTP